MRSELDKYHAIAAFVKAIDPDGYSDRFEVTVYLRSFTMALQFLVECTDSLTHAHKFPCIDVRERKHNGYDYNDFISSLIELPDPKLPTLSLEEAGKGGLKRSAFYPQEIGNDADLMKIEIREARKGARFIDRFPENLYVVQSLSPVGDVSPPAPYRYKAELVREYKLRRREVREEYEGLCAVFTRF
jgi:hypothetical protein